MIISIAKLECIKWFKTGKIWKLLALTQCILGIIFYWLTKQYLTQETQFYAMPPTFGITEEIIHPLFAWTALLFMIISPLLVSKSLVSEKKSNTFMLYLTTKISSNAIVLGKFLGIMVTQLFLLLPTLIMPLFIIIHNSLDIGQLLSSVLGLILFLSAITTIAIFIAIICKEPLTAAFFSFTILLCLSILEWVARFFNESYSWIGEIALLYHCQNAFSGVIYTQDLIYYFLFSLLFLYGSIIYLNKNPNLLRKNAI